MCCCMVLWVLFRVPTTTHFNKMCCCMVLWVLLTASPVQISHTSCQHICTVVTVFWSNSQLKSLGGGMDSLIALHIHV